MAKIHYGLVGLLSLLIGSGGTLFLTSSELNKAYVCSSNQIVGVFSSLSVNQSIGYFTQSGLKKYAICEQGTWLKLTKIINQNLPKAKQYLCDQTKCVPIQ